MRNNDMFPPGSVHPVDDRSRRSRPLSPALREDLLVVDTQFQRFFKARFRYFLDWPLTVLSGYITINLAELELLLMRRGQIRDDQSIEEAVTGHYGDDAAQMIREML